mmetsp:Transcript_32519/g.97883  ORF Transcript_32519/g.97883 Transcript_32519/m.97883 type:complete len:145 (+) Transcript_32519:305-739(+)
MSGYVGRRAGGVTEENPPLSVRVAVLGDDAWAVRRLVLFNGEGAVDADAGATALDGSQQRVARPVRWQGNRERPMQCEFWDLPAATLEAQPSVFWNVAAPATFALPRDDRGKPFLQAADPGGNQPLCGCLGGAVSDRSRGAAAR